MVLAASDTASEVLIAGLELGGTKALAVLAEGTTIVDRLRVPTTEPGETLGRLGDQLQRWSRDRGDVQAVGIGSFGPLGLDPVRAAYGCITTTPKPGWADTDVLGAVRSVFDGPVGFDTDVNGAALAETRWGAGRGCDTVVYFTIGTGIGGGVVVAGRPVHGLVHPELGHVRVRRTATDAFAGVCPYHGDCIEGLAAGPAIAARAGAPAETLAADHAVWDDVAADLGELVAVTVLALSPHRVIIGGGVGGSGAGGTLLPRVRTATGRALAGYVGGFDADEVIVAPALGPDAGPLGAIAIGLDALAAAAQRTAGA